MKIGDKFRYKNSTSESKPYDRFISRLILDNDGGISAVISTKDVMYGVYEIEIEPIQKLRDKKISKLLNGN
jgi:hypothetical protein